MFYKACYVYLITFFLSCYISYLNIKSLKDIENWENIFYWTEAAFFWNQESSHLNDFFLFSISHITKHLNSDMGDSIQKAIPNPLKDLLWKNESSKFPPHPHILEKLRKETRFLQGDRWERE